MVSHTKALHIALKPYPSMVEVAFFAASINQRDQEYIFRRSMAKASTSRNTKPSRLASGYLRHPNSVHQPYEEA